MKILGNAKNNYIVELSEKELSALTGLSCHRVSNVCTPDKVCDIKTITDRLIKLNRVESHNINELKSANEEISIAITNFEILFKNIVSDPTQEIKFTDDTIKLKPV